MQVKKRNPFVIMFELIKLVSPLSHIMLFTITMGVLGFLAAIFILVLGAIGLLDLLGYESYLTFKQVIGLMIFCAIVRGFLRYAEQWSGHFIAFKLLELLRHRIFAALRRLTFDKLQQKNSGQLISMITVDVELLEVFYAHTIAPISIAFITSLILLIIFSKIALSFAFIAFLAYTTVGILIPVLLSSNARREHGRKFRNQTGELHQYVLDSIQGIREIILYGQQQVRREQMQQRSIELAKSFYQIKQQQADVRFWTEIAVSGFNILFFATSIYLISQGLIDFNQLLVGIILMMSSFGPVVILSSLSNNLLQTLASGERILDLLEQQPEIDEVNNGFNINNLTRLNLENVSFSYNKTQGEVLSDINFTITPNKITGIYGKSGSGKSTLLYLIMRFFDVSKGAIYYNDINIKELNSKNLRDNTAFISQSTYIFNESIYENILMANRNANKTQVEEAAKKASIHEFILSLPKGYDTVTSELGANLSDGEKQRIGIARAFLHNAPLILLDEPTSNLDSLNEAIILKSLLDAKAKKMIVLVSHRKSTMAICDTTFSAENGRLS